MKSNAYHTSIAPWKRHVNTLFIIIFAVLLSYQSSGQTNYGSNNRQQLNEWHQQHNEYYQRLDSIENAKNAKQTNGTQKTGASPELYNFNCQNLWLSGANVAWNEFGRDVGDNSLDITYFENMFDDVVASGGNSMRWWLHTNVSFTPIIDANGYCSGLGNNVLNEIEQVLDAAEERNIALDICLFSFDMLQNQWEMDPVANYNFLTSASNIQSYIDNALTPMVNQFKDHKALLCWEVFNEPEGMTNEFGWTPTKVNMFDIQRVVNMVAGEIHRLDPNTPVTNGSWSFRALTDILSGTNEMNYYRDDRLISAGGDADGTLDFYQVHYYSWAGTALSPFHHDKSYWGLSKPLMVAEYHVEETFGVAANDLYDELYHRGYFGGWGWQYNETNLWNTINPAMQSLYSDHSSEIDLDYLSGCTSSQSPVVNITSPSDNAVYSEPASITIEASASDPDGTITSVQFYNGATLLGTDNTAPYTYDWTGVNAGNYTLTAVAMDNESLTTTSTAINITVNACPNLVATNDERCDAGQVNLGVAGGGGSYDWYENEIGGSSIASGSSYNPTISATTIYYVEEQGNSVTSENFGETSQSTTAAIWNIDDFATSDKKIEITVSSNVTLDAVYVYPQNNGTNVTINISQGVTNIKTVTVNGLNSGKQKIVIDQLLTPGTYLIDAIGTSDRLEYQSEEGVFPYSISGVISFTGTESWVISGGRYGLFYDWEVTYGSASSCPRVAVTGTIDSNGPTCNLDCNSDANGTASVDQCGVCSGGNTGVTPNSTCADCNGDANGTASVDQCGVCSGGSTGVTPNSTCSDCNGDANGTASVDQCGVCSGGNTGVTPNSTCADCNGDANGTASVDQCGVCSGGNTGVTPNSTCADCNGDANGIASVDQCGVCSGGNSGVTPNSTCADCNGDANGTASVDQCGVCSGGNTGVTPNSTCADCNGDANGTASVDQCGVCSGGNTGVTPNSTCADCNGDANGMASVDQCGVCSGGNTGVTPNSTCADCNGDANGTASVDQCGVCSGGNTGVTPNSTCLDCNGNVNGTASVDQCGVCSGGNTGVTPNSTCEDCNGDPNGMAAIDNCSVCSGGNTGVVVDDCLTSINQSAINQSINIYPNPTHGIFKIESSVSDLTWSIYNLLGELVLNGNSDFVNLETQPCGIYLLVTEQGTIRVEKE